MKVLIACEESQVVCKAFRNRGHIAYSCDLQECSGGHPEWHIKDDVLNIIGGGWDLMIAHPPCTYLCNSGVRWIYEKPGRKEQLEKSIEFFYKLYNANIPKIAIENPIPHKYAKLPEYNQLIQPYQFGHFEQKATCLWLKSLPGLLHTSDNLEYTKKLPKKEAQKIYYCGKKDRSKIRSKTFEGIALAMATQWG